MFVSGTRDALGSRDALRRAARRVRGPVTWFWIETGDHSFKPLKASGLAYDAVLEDLAGASADWVASL
jgi:predicted alpha/beta-hydrolase family hydrolase